ncbi:hypothetical protein ACROYT_G038327 [Oculina patagonica]
MCSRCFEIRSSFLGASFSIAIYTHREDPICLSPGPHGSRSRRLRDPPDSRLRSRDCKIKFPFLFETGSWYLRVPFEDTLLYIFTYQEI